MPHKGLDPIVQAASTIMRLQTIVSREVDPSDFAVVTVSAFHAGDRENIIPQEADLKLNVRTAQPETRTHVLKSIDRIIESEAVASGSPRKPVLTELTKFPFLYNDADVTAALEPTFRAHFGDDYDADVPRLAGSEDFGILATAIGKPSCFFLYGGWDTDTYDAAEREGKLKELPVNHSPFFLPDWEKSLEKGAEAYIVSALTFLGKS